MNDTETIIKYLKLYNEWRRGDEKMGQPNPIEIGKLLDEACEKLASLERERDKASAWIGEIFRLLGLPDGDMGAVENLRRECDEAREEVKHWKDMYRTVSTF